MTPPRLLTPLCSILLCSTPLLAASKPAPVTQDGVLVSFTDVPGGSTCQGGIYTASCQTLTERHYTVRIGEQQLVLVHILSKADRRRTIGSGIWKLPPDQHSILYNQLPGLHFQTWNDKEGVHIQLGDKDSLFQIVGASATTQP